MVPWAVPDCGVTAGYHTGRHAVLWWEEQCALPLVPVDQLRDFIIKSVKYEKAGIVGDSN